MRSDNRRKTVLNYRRLRHVSMKCEELLAALNQYVDGEIEPGLCDSFERHLTDCNPCQIVVDNIRQTIRLYKAEEPFELPPALHHRLARLLRERRKGKIDEDRGDVERARRGDFEAMQSLLEKYERRIFSVARRIVKRHQDAEEVTQQTFLTVLEHLGEFREESQFRTWLLRIAANHALALLRKRSVRTALSLDAADLNDSREDMPHPDYIAVWDETPEKLALRQETKELLDAALDDLDEKYRVAFILRDIEGLSTRETAEIMEITPEAVKVRLLRARLMLRERLTRHFGDESTKVAGHAH
jgi:RNA polymerase sigma-70 factor (ECF subfamily)